MTVRPESQASEYRIDKCKAAGKNYNLPHVTGAVYREDGSCTITTRCVFCGGETKL